MSHIINFCPLTKFDGGLLRLHEADEAAVDWLTTWLLAHANNNSRKTTGRKTNCGEGIMFFFTYKAKAEGLMYCFIVL